MTFSIVDEPELQLPEKQAPGEIDWLQEAKDRLDLSEEELVAQIDECVERFDGLVGREAATILVARSHDVDLVDELRDDPSRLELEVDSLVPGMGAVDILVAVKSVESTNQFDGGQVRSAIVADTSGETQVTFWDDDVHALDNVEEGDHLVVRNGYTNQSIRDYQKDRFGVPAIQVGDETTVELSNEEGTIEIVEPEG